MEWGKDGMTKPKDVIEEWVEQGLGAVNRMQRDGAVPAISAQFLRLLTMLREANKALKFYADGHQDDGCEAADWRERWERNLEEK